MKPVSTAAISAFLQSGSSRFTLGHDLSLAAVGDQLSPSVCIRRQQLFHQLQKYGCRGCPTCVLPPRVWYSLLVTDSLRWNFWYAVHQVGWNGTRKTRRCNLGSSNHILNNRTYTPYCQNLWNIALGQLRCSWSS